MYESVLYDFGMTKTFKISQIDYIDATSTKPINEDHDKLWRNVKSAI